MTVFVAIALALMLTALVVCAWALANSLQLLREMEETMRRLVTLSLNPRTRLGHIAPQSGPVSREQTLSRLGRASAARRVVVGGDDDSQLYHDLNMYNRAPEETPGEEVK